MEVRHTRDIVTFKNLISLKATDHELEVMAQDAKLIMSNINSSGVDISDTPTIQFLQALTELSL